MPSNLGVGQHRWDQQLVLTRTKRINHDSFVKQPTLGFQFFGAQNFSFLSDAAQAILAGCDTIKIGYVSGAYIDGC